MKLLEQSTAPSDREFYLFLQSSDLFVLYTSKTIIVGNSKQKPKVPTFITCNLTSIKHISQIASFYLKN